MFRDEDRQPTPTAGGKRRCLPVVVLLRSPALASTLHKQKQAMPTPTRRGSALPGEFRAVPPSQVEDVNRFYQVVDPDMGINLRAEPDTSAAGTAYVLIPGEAFHVSRVIRHGGQEYLYLSDGRGWAFTRSKTGARICEGCTEEEVPRLPSGPAPASPVGGPFLGF